jgi:TolA-binding protein
MLGQESAGSLPLQATLTRFQRRTARLVVGVLLLGGCATSADVAGLATQDDVLRLRADVTALQRSVQQARPQSEAASPQGAARARESADADRAINQRLDGLTATLNSLTKRVDDLALRVEALGRQARPTPVTGRPAPAAPPTGASPAPAAAAAPTPGSPSASGPTRAAPGAAPPAGASTPSSTVATATPSAARPATTGALQAQDLYQAAYIDFSKGSYALAIDGFREFLRRYPDHVQANSAQYWIGEGYVALAQQATNAGQSERATEALLRAVQEFRKVVANYPRGDRAPTALYKEALALIELKQPAVAQARLQYLIDNFPQAEETPRARERLAAMRQR